MKKRIIISILSFSIILFSIVLICPNIFAEKIGGAVTGSTVTGETVTGEATQVFTINAQMVAVPPTLSITSPKNQTYLTNTSLLLNYTSSNALNLWYNLDNEDNNTITSSTTFNVSQGEHILYLYANNSDGNLTSASISFTANS